MSLALLLMSVTVQVSSLPTHTSKAILTFNLPVHVVQPFFSGVGEGVVWFSVSHHFLLMAVKLTESNAVRGW